MSASIKDAERICTAVSGYAGRTCRECRVPMGGDELEAKATPLPIPDDDLTQDVRRGVVTGASAVHWPCLGAIAIAAHEQAIGFAVADHGLKDWQQVELQRIGVRWIEHDRPELSAVKQASRIPSDLRAWWKPWVCLASPFQRSVWVDSDAAVVGGLTELFADDAPRVAIQRLWVADESRLYRELVSVLFGKRASTEILPTLANINSGVVAWSRGEPLLDEWKAWCEVLMSDAELTKHCRVRDQAGLLVALVKRAIDEREIPALLSDEWNIPADYLPANQSTKRLPINLRPARFLHEARQRHPDARIVHWLGGIKPWKLSKTK
jgi:hypothetical protein